MFVFPQLLVTVATAAGLTRFLRLSRVCAPLRDRLHARSSVMAVLFSCPHCLCFWISLICALLLAPSLLQAGILTLLGWRGGYHTNRLIDVATRPARHQEPAGSSCLVCGRPRTAQFLERRGHVFCSYRCWFEHLRSRAQENRAAQAGVFARDGTPVNHEVYSGTFATVNVDAARLAMTGPDPSVYIDVRTPEEYDRGHPEKAVNIPLYNLGRDQLVPNTDFLHVVTACFPRNTHLMVGGGVGSRALHAARILAGAGYTDIAYVEGGFHGCRNLRGDRVAAGWVDRAYPIEYRSLPQQRYANLIRRTRVVT